MSLEPIDDLHDILNKTLGIESPIRWQKHLEATIPLYNAWHRDNNERVKTLAAKKGITLIGKILKLRFSSGVRGANQDTNRTVKLWLGPRMFGVTEFLGNYFNGVAVNNCIYHSIKAAEDLLQVQTSHERLIATKF